MEDTYQAVPYHSWFHALDVLHGVFRWHRLLRTEKWLSTVDRYSLLVSAVGHDAGHMGFNNNYLIETSHELALFYNDRSPLENMHCTRMFEIIQRPDHNIFLQLPAESQKAARKMCVEAILHTDNSHHFQMIMDLQVLLELHTEIFNEAMGAYQVDPTDFPSKEVLDVYWAKDTRILLGC